MVALLKNLNATKFLIPQLIWIELMMWKSTYEPGHEKTSLQGFRPGLTQTGLYSHRR